MARHNKAEDLRRAKATPTVNQRISQLKRQKRVTGGKSVALPPGVRKTTRKKAKSKRGTFHK